MFDLAATAAAEFVVNRLAPLDNRHDVDVVVRVRQFETGAVVESTVEVDNHDAEVKAVKEVEELSEDITGHSVSDISQRGIKLVPEDRRPFSGLTVQENLQLSVDTSHGDDWDVFRVLSEFERLYERPSQRASHLSGGEQQMLVIAIALVGNPKLVLLDEPMEGLAPQIVE